MKRKIAVILAAGVDRYKERVAKDEDGTLRHLVQCRAQLEASVRQHDGRVFNTAGDALLAEFASAVEAVRCAAAVQRSMREVAANQPAGAPAGSCLDYRIGITLGDVMQQDGGDLLGDGVNIAARLQGIAAPGGIAVSRSIVEHVAAKLPLAFIDRGFLTLKNMPEPVHAYVIDLDGKPSGRPGRIDRRRRGWLMPAALLAGGGLAVAVIAFALLPRDAGKGPAPDVAQAGAVTTTAATASSAPISPPLGTTLRIRCAEILERVQLGRLTAEDRVTLQRDCH